MITEQIIKPEDATDFGSVAVIKINLMRSKDGDFLSAEVRLPVEGMTTFHSYPNRFKQLVSDELSSPVLAECSKLIQHISTIIPKE